MAQARCPGNFILDIANTGLGVTASLSRFGSGYRVKNVANSISLSATLLIEVGRDVNKNEAFFKDNFEAKFQGALAKCKKEYEQVVAAVEKVQSWKKDETDETKEGPPKKPWKKLAWGLGMTDDEFSDFEDELDESYKIAMMAQVIVQLVILQVNAQKRELSQYEILLLRRVKKAMGEFLELLHETGVANVMVFSLNEPTMPANITQVAQAIVAEKKDGKKDDDAASSASITIRNPTEISVPLKKAPGLGPPPPPAPAVGTAVPYRAPDVYEMHHASIDAREKKSKQTIFRFLGVPLKVNRIETEVVCALSKVPMPHDDIKAFLEKNKDATAKQTAIETLMTVPAATSTAVYAYLATKADMRIYQAHTWSVECVVASPADQPKAHRFWSKKTKEATSHVIVLKGEPRFPGGGFQRPGPPPGWRGPPIVNRRPASSRSSSMASRRRSKAAAKFELSQQETENVINDYLASFSTLYDGVPAEQRGAALKAIVLPTEDDSDYDSDASSSSGSSGSLVDD
ncbi:hypothetical protein DL98DRAFT_522295 [Cadophora sp. DSE1049]|nr:hypothetical protein DL98DRAFT_522295 [Cadophora sp. DSE1049]